MTTHPDTIHESGPSGRRRGFAPGATSRLTSATADGLELGAELGVVLCSASGLELGSVLGRLRGSPDELEEGAEHGVVLVRPMD